MNFTDEAPVLRCCLLHLSEDRSSSRTVPSVYVFRFHAAASHDRSDKDSCSGRSCDTRIVLSQCLENLCNT